jgi:hypothetical protein
MPENVKTAVISLCALGSEAANMQRVGTSASWFAVTPHGETEPLAFVHWGQDDVFFGGDEMDVPYDELP